jgi:hypothetical protein
MTGEYQELTAADLAYRWRERTVLESLDESLAEARATSEEYATPDSALRWLLRLAWSDLQMARHDARNGKWSIACDHQVSRIAGLTRLVGPVSWEVVPVDLILDGIYERIHEAIGTPTPLSDDDRQQAREVMEARYVHHTPGQEKK